MATRRQWLGSLAAGIGASAGCLEPSSAAEPHSDPAAPPPEADPMVVYHWDNGVGVAIPDLLDAFARTERDIASSTAVPQESTRAAFDQFVAEALVDFRPPSTLLTVAGGMLGRYVTTVHVHPIPDIVDETALESVIQEAAEAVVFDGQPYAVPVAGWQVNRLCYRPALLDDAGVSPAELVDPAAIERLAGATDAGVVACSSSWDRFSWWCHATSLVAGLDGLDALRDESMADDQLEAISELYASLLAASIDTETVDDTVDRFLTDEIALLRATPPSLARLVSNESDDWETIEPPVGADTVVLDVLALPFPKRNPTPTATERFLRFTASGPASQWLSVPGVVPCRSEQWQNLGKDTPVSWERYRNATDVVLSAATGCGMDPNTRWIATDQLDTLPRMAKSNEVQQAMKLVFE